MNIKLYMNSADPRVVHKNPTQVKDLNGQLIDGTSVETPTVQIEMVNITSFNYCYIASFGRYYYVTNYEVIAGSHLILHLKSDPLMSFWDNYKKSSCIASRSSNLYDNEIDDSEVITLSTKTYQHRTLNGKFTPTDSTYNYILTVAGGGTASS